MLRSRALTGEPVSTVELLDLATAIQGGGESYLSHRALATMAGQSVSTVRRVRHRYGRAGDPDAPWMEFRSGGQRGGHQPSRVRLVGWKAPSLADDARNEAPGWPEPVDNGMGESADLGVGISDPGIPNARLAISMLPTSDRSGVGARTGQHPDAAEGGGVEPPQGVCTVPAAPFELDERSIALASAEPPESTQERLEAGGVDNPGPALVREVAEVPQGPAPSRPSLSESPPSRVAHTGGAGSAPIGLASAGSERALSIGVAEGVGPATRVGPTAGPGYAPPRPPAPAANPGDVLPSEVSREEVVLIAAQVRAMLRASGRLAKRPVARVDLIADALVRLGMIVGGLDTAVRYVQAAAAPRVAPHPYVPGESPSRKMPSYGTIFALDPCRAVGATWWRDGVAGGWNGTAPIDLQSGWTPVGSVSSSMLAARTARMGEDWHEIAEGWRIDEEELEELEHDNEPGAALLLLLHYGLPLPAPLRPMLEPLGQPQRTLARWRKQARNGQSRPRELLDQIDGHARPFVQRLQLWPSQRRAAAVRDASARDAAGFLACVSSAQADAVARTLPPEVTAAPKAAASPPVSTIVRPEDLLRFAEQLQRLLRK